MPSRRSSHQLDVKKSLISPVDKRTSTQSPKSRRQTPLPKNQLERQTPSATSPIRKPHHHKRSAKSVARSLHQDSELIPHANAHSKKVYAYKRVCHDLLGLKSSQDENASFQHPGVVIADARSRHSTSILLRGVLRLAVCTLVTKTYVTT